MQYAMGFERLCAALSVFSQENRMTGKVLVTAEAFDRSPAPAGSGFAGAADILESAGLELIRLFKNNPSDYAAADFEGKMAGVTAAIIGSEPWGEALFRACPDLKIVCRYGVGYDAVDLAAATECGVMVTNTRVPELTEAVAELSLALATACLRHMPAMHCDLKAGTWRMRRGRSLFGKTVGFVGFGAIGQCFAKLLAPFGGTRLAYSPSVSQATADAFGVRMTGLDELLAESDVVSVHAPNLPKNRHIMNAGAFAKMKPDAVLVNTARGALVDEKALYGALTSGRLYAAGLDVWEAEPTPADNPLLALENVFAQPHMGGATIESSTAIAACDAQQVLDALSGKTPRYLLNP